MLRSRTVNVSGSTGESSCPIVRLIRERLNSNVPIDDTHLSQGKIVVEQLLTRSTRTVLVDAQHPQSK